MALTVPRTGRKHLLPSAMWGRIFFDDVAIPWSSADAHRLRVVERLRAAGASEADLRRPSPLWPLLRSAGGAHTQVLSAWPLLDPWRDRLPWLEECSWSLVDLEVEQQPPMLRKGALKL
ncbi:hypothetical protein [Mobilicoccus pelagius]|nr:hypothetical protein [Mobilicoccus pelagius]